MNYDIHDAATAAAEDLHDWLRDAHFDSDTSNADIWDHDEFNEIWIEWTQGQDTDNWRMSEEILKRAVAGIWHHYK